MVLAVWKIGYIPLKRGWVEQETALFGRGILAKAIKQAEGEDGQWKHEKGKELVFCNGGNRDNRFARRFGL